MRNIYNYLTVFCLCILAVAALGFTLFGAPAVPEDYTAVDRFAKIRPDYADAVIPPNIAPLNFIVLEPGSRYLVRIHSVSDQGFNVFSRDGKMEIPLRSWRTLLGANRGEKLYFDIYVKDEYGHWRRYRQIENTIAKENIDSHIAYRLIKPIYNFWRNIGVYQRDLEGYDESLILHGKSFGGGCVNCHSFLNNNPDSMFIGTRSKTYGSAAICVRGDDIEKVGTKFGYTAWHPSGRIAAYSINKVRQFFHTFGMETRDVVDLDAAMAYYKVDSQEVKTTPALYDPNRLESYPAWSPDGKYLYFCSAPILWKDRSKLPPENYEKVKYELRRISYDIETDQWGKLETVLSVDQTGLSIMLPRISPDGRFLLFCMCDYGCFPVYQPSSDLYLMDLQTGDYRKLDINSEYSESWHSWSSNGRWIAFSSKRLGGLFTRTYFSYVDKDGKVYKPFIMPQKDPAFYDSFLKTYSVPELITGPFRISHNELGRAARAPETIEVDMPVTAATPAAAEEDMDPWQQL